MKTNWTAAERTDLVLRILAGSETSSEAAQKHGIDETEIESWKQLYLEGAQHAIRAKKLTVTRRISQRVRRHPIFAGGLAVVSLLVLLMASEATSETPVDCDDDNPANADLCQFQAGDPAVAREVNSNFTKLKLWLKQKVGAVGSSDIGTEGSISATSDISTEGSIHATGDITASGSLSVDEIDENTPGNGISIGNDLTVEGSVTADNFVAKGIVYKDGSQDSEYTIDVKRYVVIATPAKVGVVVPIDQTIIESFCKDEDGCHWTLAMVNYTAGSPYLAATRRGTLWIANPPPGEPESNWWRSDYGDGTGRDADNGPTALAAWDCYFTDAETSTNSSNGRTDSTLGFGLLNVAGGPYSDSTTECRLVLED